MANFDPKRILRQISNTLLREVFVIHGHNLEVPWAELSETKVDKVFSAWQELPESANQAIEIVLHEISEMASEDGVRAIVEEARRQGEDSLVETFDTFVSRHDKATWTYLRSNEVWQPAVRFARVDSVSRGRYWIKRAGIPAKEPHTTDRSIHALENAISAFYQVHEARGRHCRVEHYLRASGVDYFFTYLEDYADTRINFDDDGEFARTPERRAFEIVFAYDSERGTLDMYVRGGKKIYVPLQEIFCSIVLSEEIGPEDRDCAPYTLNELINRDFQFPTDIDDGITEVRVRKLRLTVKGMPRRRITLEADPDAGPDDIYNMMDLYLNRAKVPPSIVNVSQAAIKISFDQQDETLPRSLSFEVSYPNSSNLKSKPERLRLLGEKYLRSWGIDRCERTEPCQPAA